MLKNKKMSNLKILSFFILLILSITNIKSRVIVLPLQYASPNEPNQFEARSIIDYYSKNEIYTSIKMGTPPSDLEVILDDEDSGFYIKEGKCFSGSEYKIKNSGSFTSGDGFIYQYINNELTVLLNNSNDKIFLDQASKEYFYQSLKNRRFGTNLTRFEIDNFNFLYIPNSEEIKNIEDKLAQKRKKEKEEKDKKDENTDKDKDKDNDKDKDKDKNKDKDNNGYGDDYYPDYYDFYGEEEDDVDQHGFGPYYDDDDDYSPWNDYYTDTKKCGHMGLLPPGISTGLTNSKLNFIQQLKNKRIIDNYNWYIRFNKDKTGELVIGAAPHEVKPENYLEEDLYMTHAKLINDVFFWEIQFSEIYLYDNLSNQKYNLKPFNGKITINENFIYSTKEYFNNITTLYFEQYFNNKKCNIETIQKTYDRYFVIYCHQKNFTLEDLQKFPILSFQSSDLNFVFNFDYNDLFLKAKNKYIFKVIYSGDYGYWKLGKTFLEKYQFVFNYDSKMFGFYQKFIPENIEGDQIIDYNTNNNNKEKENDKLPPSNRKEIREKNKQILNEKKDYVKIVIIIILVIFVVFLFIYILRRFIFNKQINSKTIENYGKFKPNNTKDKINRLTEEYLQGENV